MTYDMYKEECAKFNVEATMSEAAFTEMLKQDELAKLPKEDRVKIERKKYTTDEERSIARREYNARYREKKNIMNPKRQYSSRVLLTEEEKKERKNKLAAERRAMFMAQGLTCDGKPRKQKFTECKLKKSTRVLLTEAEKKERNNANARKWNIANRERFNANNRKSFHANRDKRISAKCDKTVEASDSNSENNA